MSHPMNLSNSLIDTSREPGAQRGYRHGLACECRQCNREFEDEANVGKIWDWVKGEFGGIDIIDRIAHGTRSKRKCRRGHTTNGPDGWCVRDLSKIYALVLHQTAFSRGNRIDRYDNVGAHFVIIPDGRVIQLHPLEAYLHSSNGLNAGSVAVEFVGNFPNTRGTWWRGDRFGRNKPTSEQIVAGRKLVRHLISKIGLTHVLAHRQSSKQKANDPGPHIWKGVGQWALDSKGLSDGGSTFSVGTGQPIPAAWRKFTG